MKLVILCTRLLTLLLPMEIHDYVSDEVSSFEWAWHGWQEDLPGPSKNIGALYEAFAEEEEGGYASF